MKKIYEALRSKGTMDYYIWLIINQKNYFIVYKGSITKKNLEALMKATGKTLDELKSLIKQEYERRKEHNHQYSYLMNIYPLMLKLTEATLLRIEGINPKEVKKLTSFTIYKIYRGKIYRVEAQPFFHEIANNMLFFPTEVLQRWDEWWTNVGRKAFMNHFWEGDSYDRIEQ